MIIGVVWGAIAAVQYVLETPMLVSAIGAVIAIMCGALNGVCKHSVTGAIPPSGQRSPPYRTPAPSSSPPRVSQRGAVWRAFAPLMGAVVRIGLAVILAAVSVRQFTQLRAQYSWQQKPTCDSVDGSALLTAHVLERHAYVRMVALQHDQGGYGGPTLMVVARDAGPLALQQLLDIRQDVESVCRLGARFESRATLDVANADVLPVDVELRFRSLPTSPNSRSTLDSFSEIVTRNVARSFDAGPTDARRLAPECWQPDRATIVDGALSILAVHRDFEILTNGDSHVCFGTASRIAFPERGRVSVIVTPDESTIPR